MSAQGAREQAAQAHGQRLRNACQVKYPKKTFRETGHLEKISGEKGITPHAETCGQARLSADGGPKDALSSVVPASIMPRQVPYRPSVRHLSLYDKTSIVICIGCDEATQKTKNRITDCLSRGCENRLKIAYFGEEGTVVNSGRIFRPVFVTFFPTEKCGTIGQHMKSTETDCPLCFVRLRPVISPFCRRKAAKGFPRRRQTGSARPTRV